MYTVIIDLRGSSWKSAKPLLRTLQVRPSCVTVYIDIFTPEVRAVIVPVPLDRVGFPSREDSGYLFHP